MFGVELETLREAEDAVALEAPSLAGITDVAVPSQTIKGWQQEWSSAHSGDRAPTSLWGAWQLWAQTRSATNPSGTARKSRKRRSCSGPYVKMPSNQ